AGLRMGQGIMRRLTPQREPGAALSPGLSANRRSPFSARYRTLAWLNAWNGYCCKLSIASQKRIPRKEEKPLPAGEFSDKKAHANEKRFSRRRSSAPWDGGGDGPIAIRKRGRFR